MTVRKVKANSLAADIRAGVDGNALARKYELSASQLQVAVRKLLQAGLISEADLPRVATNETSQAKKGPPFPEVPGPNDELNAQDFVAKCPHCGMSRKSSESECSHCGIVFSKLDQPGADKEPTRMAPGHLDPEVQTSTYHDLIASSFYEESAEAQEEKRKKKQRIIWTAVVLGFLPIPSALLGYGRQIALAYTLGCALFIFLYYLVVVYYAARESTLWGLLCFFLSPAAILFVILNWNTVFAGKLLPRLWLAFMGPLTLVTLLARYGHLKMLPGG